ncbi:hypothetical protein [Vannielia litorea]|uniref:Uncharacterized protein n=1 Tax=Vannielia litorea TaxID=1217970 RepID=A0A1N6GYI1_9RHOB|nr:hypothetical protein [Vannielia litorea]SIO12579.1 hypothetical protein SAMN05444002_2908 [Vannielia litorea]
MTRTLFLTAAGLAALVLPGTGGAQPFSTSMAECAALHQNAAQWVEGEAEAAALMRVHAGWRDAAIAQAEAEGIADAPARMGALIDDRTGDWEARGLRLFLSREFRDWMDYCRAFAAHRGLGLDR